MKHVFSLAALCSIALVVKGQDKPPTTDASGLRPYDRVITKEAKTQKGVFLVHQIGDRYYYEIPRSELGREFQLSSQIARNTSGFAGQFVLEWINARVVRWDRRGNRVLLRALSFDITADPSQPVARAVAAENNPAILMTFNVEATGPDDAPVIEVTRLFATEVPEFSARTLLHARSLDASRTFVEHIASFPTNIEVEATQTYTLPEINSAPRFSRVTPTVVVHFSMVKLPEHPMKPRLYDSRVGYFSESTIDYSGPENWADRRTFIRHWRLEKKDPSAAVSEPVRPLVYYLDPATPKKWIPYLKRGIEAWKPAFEAAGFKNAIIAKEAPTTEEDPNWNPQDARYSVVHWVLAQEQANGDADVDPRTGEVLRARINLPHSIAKGYGYLVNLGPLDPGARTLPPSEEMIGEQMSSILTHEVGHTLGLQHNMLSKSLYPPEKLRDSEWLRTMGVTPSIMDYASVNYVAQPEDHIDPRLLRRGSIGPYDVFAIQWGYTPIPGARSPADEKETLDTWARRQDKEPWLRFEVQNALAPDASADMWVVGTADPVYSTTLGLKNLQRVMENLLATTTHDGEDWSDLNQAYASVLTMWSRRMASVARVVGSFNFQDKHAGQGSASDGVRFTLVPRTRQAAAVKFLNENAFATPALLLRPEILRRIESNGALERIKSLQMGVLNILIAPERFGRLVEQEAIDGAAAYKPLEFLGDLRKGVFAELYAPKPQIDAYRRNLQRGYIELLGSRLTGPKRATDDQRPMFRGELARIAADAATGLAHTTDVETRLHIEDLRHEIAETLESNPAIAAAKASARP